MSVPEMVKSKRTGKSSTRRKVKDINNVLGTPPEPQQLLPGYQNRLEYGIEWTPNEFATRIHIEKFRNPERPEVTFRDAFEGKLKKSDLQPFLDNSSGTFREKLDILSLKLWEMNENNSQEEKLCHEFNNNVVDDLQFRLREAAKLQSINLKELLYDVKVIRVMDAKISELDRSLKYHHQLLVLNLGINHLNTWDWKFVPRTLRILNLHANFIDDLSLFSNNSCPNLVSLVLSRNCFIDESNFLVQKFCHLNDLDLSDNDILWPSSVLTSLSSIPRLTSLSLYGNPFALSRNYKATVTTALPKLRYLDSHAVISEVKIESAVTKGKEKSPKRSSRKSARGKMKSSKGSPKGKGKGSKRSGKDGKGDQPDSVYLMFSCYRIMGLPPLSKEEVGCFHLEMDIPLLDVVRREYLMFNEIPKTEEVSNNEQLERAPHIEQSEMIPPQEKILKSWIEESQDPATLVPPDAADGGNQRTEKDNSTQKSSHENLTSIPEDTSIYKKLTLYKPTYLHQRAFETARMVWSKIVTYPAVKIACPDMIALRDTFRTVITINLIYTKGLCKQISPEKKGEKKDKENVKKKDEKKENKKEIESTNERVKEELRSVLASFRCVLNQPDWTKASQDFQWSTDLDTPYALEVKEDNFSNWRFGDTTSPRKEKKEKGKAKSKSESPTRSNKSGMKKKEKKTGGDGSPLQKTKGNTSGGLNESRPIPTSLTIHVGFAVERSP